MQPTPVRSLYLKPEVCSLKPEASPLYDVEITETPGILQPCG
jgi:hypothetical protein